MVKHCPGLGNPFEKRPMAVNRIAKCSRLFCAAIYAIVFGILPQAMAVASPSGSHISHGMELDLGQLRENVKVTADYSNAVFRFVLPRFSEVEQRLNLPGKHEILPSDVLQFHVLPFRDVSASIRLKDGKVFNYASGFVSSYTSPQSPTYSHLRPDASFPKSQKLLTQREAVQTARDAIAKLEAEVNADSGIVESLYYDDKTFWNSRPPIDMPISAGKP
jgi:hypothetical protein